MKLVSCSGKLCGRPTLRRIIRVGPVLSKRANPGAKAQRAARPRRNAAENPERAVKVPAAFLRRTSHEVRPTAI